MNYKPDIHHRRAIRLNGYDYSQAGAYFVTICSQGKEPIFENINIKQILVDEWHSLAHRFPNIELDEFVVMPNHVHGIIVIGSVGVGLALPSKAGLALPNNISNTAKGEPRLAPTQEHKNNTGGTNPGSTLGDIICAFKSRTAIHINRYRNTHGKPVWQRNYYEHIIRSEASMRRTREYIVNNPMRWDIDVENPINNKITMARDYYNKIF
ncbi:MAG: transposase [Deltaproteobacteria bacterium]|nr:transposase [Deltaproteobacteria bacterium]